MNRQPVSSAATHLAQIIMLATIALGTLQYGITESGYPSGDMLGAFEVLRNAEAAGADITSLVYEYNSLLQSSSAGDSLGSLNSRAIEAQESAFEQSNYWKILMIIMVPVVALLLALGIEGAFHVRKFSAKRRMFDHEVART